MNVVIDRIEAEALAPRASRRMHYLWGKWCEEASLKSVQGVRVLECTLDNAHTAFTVPGTVVFIPTTDTPKQFYSDLEAAFLQTEREVDREASTTAWLLSRQPQHGKINLMYWSWHNLSGDLSYIASTTELTV